MLDFTMCMLTGPPGDVSNITIAPAGTKTCDFIVQWNKVPGDTQHSLVSYTLTVIGLERKVVYNHTTPNTSYTVPGLSSDTDYIINVTATNMCGNGSGMIRMNASNGKLISCA